MKHYFSLLLIILIPAFVLAQSKIENSIDSILLLPNIKNTQKVDIIHEFLLKNNVDSVKLSELYNTKSVELFREFQDSKAAIKMLKLGVAIRKKNIKNNIEAYRKSLSNLTIFYRIDEQYINVIKTCKKLVENSINDKYSCKAHLELGLVYMEAGDFDKAKINFNKVIQIFTNLEPSQTLYKAHINLSFLYSNMGYVQYAPEIQHHIKILDSLNLASNKTLDKITKQNKTKLTVEINYFVANIKGNLYVELGQYIKAEKHLNVALKMALKEKDDFNTSQIFNSLGVLHLKLKKYGEAINYLRKGLDYTSTPFLKLLIQNNIGKYYKETGDFINAEKFYKLSLNMNIKDSINVLPTNTQLQFQPNKYNYIYFLNNLYELYYDKYLETNDKSYIEKASLYIKLSDDLLDIIRNESTELNSKYFWRANSCSVYLKGIKIANILNNPDDALYYIEKNKVLLLLEDLKKTQARNTSNFPDSLYNKSIGIKSNINKLKKLLINEQNEENRATLKTEILDAKIKLQLFNDEINEKYSTYRKLGQNVTICSIADVNNKLITKDDALLEFIMDSTRAYVYVQTLEEQSIHIIDNPIILSDKISEIVHKINTPFYNQKDFTEFETLSHQLYLQLFSKIEKSIFLKKELIIIPDGGFSSLPFEVLITNPASKNKYLIQSKIISYALSASHNIQNNLISRSATRNIGGFAPVKFNNKKLSELKYSEEEINYIIDKVGGDKYLRQRASKANFVENASKYKILHIASHANFDDTNSSWLWFRDEKLYQVDLFQSPINAELVVLSACKTNKGKYIKGEGQISLAREFLKSGANSVISSLWDVNDKSNKFIISYFYKNLKKHHSKSASLQEAKIKYLNTYNGTELSPYYWASSILIGNNKAINLEAYPSSIIFYILVPMVFVLFLVLRKKVKYKG